MRIIKSILIIVIAVFLTTSGEQVQNNNERGKNILLTSPYLQNPSPDAMTVIWISR